MFHSTPIALIYSASPLEPMLYICFIYLRQVHPLKLIIFVIPLIYRFYLETGDALRYTQL